MERKLSYSISWLRFPLIFLIILLHCYSVQKLDGNHESYFKTIYPFALWLGETGVPCFFFISGYLFFISSKSYIVKIQTRLHTLLIPYILWNLLLLSAYVFVSILGFPPIINGRGLTDYSFIDYLRLFWDRGSFDNGNFVPLLCPFWYIRNLLIMSLLSPIIFFFIKYTRGIMLIVLLIWWLTTYHNAFIPQTFLFFCLGAYFSIFNINPLEMTYNKKIIFILLFALFGAGDILSHITSGTPINLQIHRCSIIFNIFALLLLSNFCTQNKYINSKIFQDSAFIVFCVHYPIVAILKRFYIFKFANHSDLFHIILYFTTVTITTLISISIYIILNKFFPKTKKILSGNR